MHLFDLNKFLENAKNRSLAIFLVSRICSALSVQMITVAVGWQIYALTKSPFYLGLVGLAQFIPMILLTLAVGYAADHYNRKLIICLCQAAEALCFFALAFASFRGMINKESILAVVFLIGALNAFQGPSTQSLLPNIVERSNFPKAAAWSASAFQVATIIGPALGGLLYAFGPEVVYAIAGLFILTSSVIIIFVKAEQHQETREPATLKSILAGISFIKNKPMILGAISLDLFAVLFGGATALLPVYAATILMIGPVGLGLLRSAPAAGALIVSFLLARRPVMKKVGITMFTAVIIFGLGTIFFAISRSFIFSLAMLFIMGASDVISVVIRSTLVQMETPDQMRGRVSSVNQVFVGTSNQLGEFESGLTASLFGTVNAALIGGIGTVCVVLLWMKLFPQLRKINRFEHDEKAEADGLSNG
jgi:MFS family permease